MIRLTRTPDQIRTTLLKLGASWRTADGFARSMGRQPDPCVRRTAETAFEGGRVDRFEACDILQITSVQFVYLSDNPTFPRPVQETKFTIFWSRDEIMSFKSKLDWARSRGCRVPECLYAWEVDRPRRQGD
jgi:hypothetical protein